MKIIDQETWPRAAQFDLFRTYEKPHYAVTSRLDVTGLRAADVSSYRACLYAIGAGLHGVGPLLMRFRGDVVVQHDTTDLSMTVPSATGFNYAYVPYVADFVEFDRDADTIIKAAAQSDQLGANTDQTDAVAYLSCMPWLDYTSINNALASANDCIPRVSWGKYVQDGPRWKMAMTLEVHHALVDGQHVGEYFEIVQNVLDAF